MKLQFSISMQSNLKMLFDMLFTQDTYHYENSQWLFLDEKNFKITLLRKIFFMPKQAICNFDKSSSIYIPD